MGSDHNHEWMPDGDSWKSRVCDCEIEPRRYGGERHHHRRQNPGHYIRKRRYMCHCGEMKVVEFEGGAE